MQTQNSRGCNIYYSLLNFNCDTDRIQTCDLLIRSQVLYSAKLRCLGELQKYLFFANSQKKVSELNILERENIPLGKCYICKR